MRLKNVQISGKMWRILVGTFLTNAAYWMTWPFLALILHHRYGLSPSYIGGLLSMSVFFSALIGIYFGYIADKLGRAKVMTLGCIISVIAFTLLALSDKLNIYISAIMLVGLANALLDPLGKAVFSDLVKNPRKRHFALQLRYWTVNTGVAIGPLVATYFGLAAKQNTFMVTALAFLIYLVLLYPLINRNVADDGVNSNKVTSVPSFIKVFDLLISDYAFLVVVIANILLWIVFVQFESSLILYLSILDIPNLTKLLSVIIFTNALTVITLQFPLMVLIKNFTISQRIYLSMLLLAITQLMFAFIPHFSYFWWIISTFFYSISEAILVPNLNINIDTMAPDNLKSSYFAVSFLYRIGAGAFIGGLLLDKIGGIGLYLTMFFICCLAAILYFYAQGLPRGDSL